MFYVQAIEWPLKHPESFARLGLKRPRGVLLDGPPGCCKTTLVRAAATSCKCTFLALSCAQLYLPYVGDAERRIREVRWIYSTSYLFYHKYSCFSAISISKERENKQRLQT